MLICLIKKQNFNKIKSKKLYCFYRSRPWGKDPGAIGQLGSLEKYNFKGVNFIGKRIRKDKKYNSNFISK